MNDIIYEILDAAACLITGSNAYMLILNIMLSVRSMFPGSDCLTVFDLSGNSSKYSCFCPVYHDIYDMIDILTDMQKQLDSGKNAERWIVVNNIDDIINNIYTAADKKHFLRLLSDVLHRGGSAGLHVMVTANKYTIPVISGIECRVYSGKCDKKTAVKFFGTDAAALLNSDLPDFSQALARIDSDIYKINVPEVSESALDSIMQDLTGIADNAPVCPVNAPTVRPAHIRIKSRIKTAAPTETALQPDIQQSDTIPDDTDKNLIVLLLSAIIALFSGIFSRISAVKTRSFLVKIPAAIAVLILSFLLIPIKFLHAVATSAGSTGFSGGFTVLCMVYLLSCAAVGLMG